MRAKFKDQRELIERMWHEGATIKEITEALGVKAFNPHERRKSGLNLPLRRTPEDIERIVAGRKAAKLRRAVR